MVKKIVVWHYKKITMILFLLDFTFGVNIMKQEYPVSSKQ